MTVAVPVDYRPFLKISQMPESKIVYDYEPRIEAETQEFTITRHIPDTVELDHLRVGNPDKSPMIVLHGMLGSKINWRGMCSQEEIGSKRDCYLLELRNHATSGHHPEHNYDAISEDVIRFADQNGIKNFTILGHSMGGRTAMTVACKFPDRVNGVISIDSAPVDESGP